MTQHNLQQLTVLPEQHLSVNAGETFSTVETLGAPITTTLVLVVLSVFMTRLNSDSPTSSHLCVLQGTSQKVQQWMDSG